MLDLNISLPLFAVDPLLKHLDPLHGRYLQFDPLHGDGHHHPSSSSSSLTQPDLSPSDQENACFVDHLSLQLVPTCQRLQGPVADAETSDGEVELAMRTKQLFPLKPEGEDNDEEDSNDGDKGRSLCKSNTRGSPMAGGGGESVLRPPPPWFARLAAAAPMPPSPPPWVAVPSPFPSSSAPNAMAMAVAMAGGIQRARRSRRGPRSRSSEYRGVTFYRRTGRWESHIWDTGKQVYLGGFDTAHAAARAYDRAAIKFRGVDADINFHISDYEDEIKHMSNLTKEEFVQVLRRQSMAFPRASTRFRGVNLQKYGRWMGHLFGHKIGNDGTLPRREAITVTATDPATVPFINGTVPKDGGSVKPLDLSLRMPLRHDEFAEAHSLRSSTHLSLSDEQLNVEKQSNFDGSHKLFGSVAEMSQRQQLPDVLMQSSPRMPPLEAGTWPKWAWPVQRLTPAAAFSSPELPAQASPSLVSLHAAAASSGFSPQQQESSVPHWFRTPERGSLSTMSKIKDPCSGFQLSSQDHHERWG